MPRILIKDQAEQKTIILLPPPPPFSPKEIIKSDQLSWTPPKSPTNNNTKGIMQYMLLLR